MTRSPAQIREAIAQARSDLGAHLNALANPQLFEWGDGPGGKTMPTKAKPKRSSSKTETSTVKAGAARKAKPKSPGAKSKKSAAVHIVESAAATVGHALDTMAAGAVVGAVKAAARSISEAETKTPKGKAKLSAGGVLNEMAPDAAAGAIAGAAQAMLPQSSEAKREVAKVTKAKAAKKK